MENEFNLAEIYQTYQKDPESLVEQHTEENEIPQALNEIFEAISVSPESITNENYYQLLEQLLLNYSSLPLDITAKLVDIITSGFSAQIDIVDQCIISDEHSMFPSQKIHLEMYAFLISWVLNAIQALADVSFSSKSFNPLKLKNSKNDSTNTTTGNNNQNGSKIAKQSMEQLQSAFITICKVLKLKLSKIFVTASERDLFINLFTSPIFILLENEQFVKNISLKMYIFKILCLSIKHHGYAFGAQVSILQALSYSEHLSEPFAEFLQILYEQYDYPQLTDEILKDISNRTYNLNDVKGPKSISAFLVRLATLLPNLVLKQMTLVSKLLDADPHPLRSGVIEVCGVLIASLSGSVEQAEEHTSQINSLIDLVLERFLDLNPYCRARAIQTAAKIISLDAKFLKHRQRITNLTVQSLEDKSIHVRRNAIKLICRLLCTHPFNLLHDGLLSLKDWQQRLHETEKELNELIPSDSLLQDSTSKNKKIIENDENDKDKENNKNNDKNNNIDDDIDEKLAENLIEMSVNYNENENNNVEMTETEITVRPLTKEDQTAILQAESEDARKVADIKKLQLIKNYYIDAIKFIESMHRASESISILLTSKNKIEAIEAMDFYAVADTYALEIAKYGIRKMLHLVWVKTNNDEGKGIQSKLLDVYKSLFFDTPDDISSRDAATIVARNLISLTYGATLAELTSLEKLLNMALDSDLISDLVIHRLWQVYNFPKQISRVQRRGAIIILGMLALSDNEIILRQIDSLLRIGLGKYGREDLNLAKYTCIALRRMAVSQNSSSDLQKFIDSKIPPHHTIIQKLVSIIEMHTENQEWYAASEQAINAIYELCRHPDQVCTDIIRAKCASVFSETESEISEEKLENDLVVGLSQLLFIVGHTAIKQIVFLEWIESSFKKLKASKENEKKKLDKNSNRRKSGAVSKRNSLAINVGMNSTNTINKRKSARFSNAFDDKTEDDFDMITGTSEDDFTDAISSIRENELLYSPNSLLGKFGPLVVEILKKNHHYADQRLQLAATLCLAKLMCVSARFCEANIPLLITILEKSKDPITRSNVVLSLGDMTVCFNHLLDDYTEYMYRRLHDSNPTVQRTCLMTLTFLILAGQIKVKGQLGEMAKCLEDEDKGIADLSRMFFTELATKDNAVYNSFIDIFSVLAADSQLSEESFRRIIRFIVSFIEKEKHAKQLSEKLAARFKWCETERQWNDIAFTLSILPYKNEEIQKIISEGFKLINSSRN